MSKVKILILMIFLSLLFGCKQTHLIKTWYDKSEKNNVFNKVLVVGFFKNDVHRRTFEASLAYKLDKTGKHIIPAYKVTPKPDGLYKKETIAKAVKDIGADFIIASFFKGLKNKYNKIQGEVEYRLGSINFNEPYYDSHLGYDNFYTYTIDQIIKEGYIEVNTIIIIETVIYSVKKQKVVWVGLSETKNAQVAKDITKDLAGLILSDLKDHKIIK